jgi:hypothetical protein
MDMNPIIAASFPIGAAFLDGVGTMVRNIVMPSLSQLNMIMGFLLRTYFMKLITIAGYNIPKISQGFWRNRAFLPVETSGT